jgi:group I intron endonuclease
MNKLSGIYRIVCIGNGDYYYGSSKNINRRWVIHKNRLKVGKHHNFKLQKLWDRYGENFFRIELIELVSNDKLSSVETKYLQEHYNTPHCLNLTIDASSPTRNCIRGTPTIETRNKISKALTGRKMDAKVKQKISETLKKYKKTEEHCSNLSKSLVGFKHSDETKEKMKNAKQGKSLPIETKQKMSESHKGINTWAKGRKMSDEEKKMRSEVQKKRWNNTKNANTSYIQS